MAQKRKKRFDGEGLQADKGRVLMQWSFPEFEVPDRGPLWYVIAFSIIGGLVTYAIWDSNTLFALIILLFSFILFTHHRSNPLTIGFSIFERGVQIGDDFYLFKEIESFAVLYEPPIVERLYIVPRRAMIRREIGIPLKGQDPIRVRSLLLDFVTEDLEREAESSNDVIVRLLKL